MEFLNTFWRSLAEERINHECMWVITTEHLSTFTECHCSSLGPPGSTKQSSSAGDARVKQPLLSPCLCPLCHFWSGLVCPGQAGVEVPGSSGVTLGGTRSPSCLSAARSHEGDPVESVTGNLQEKKLKNLVVGLKWLVTLLLLCSTVWLPLRLFGFTVTIWPVFPPRKECSGELHYCILGVLWSRCMQAGLVHHQIQLKHK